MDELNVENAGAIFYLAQIFHKIRAQLIFPGLIINSNFYPTEAGGFTHVVASELTIFTSAKITTVYISVELK